MLIRLLSAFVDHPVLAALPRRVRAAGFAVAIVGNSLTSPVSKPLARAACDSVRTNDAKLSGQVRDAATGAPVAKGVVVAKWVDLTLRRGGFAKSTETASASSEADGSYMICGLPPNATLVVWVEHSGATSGVVPVTLDHPVNRLDLAIDLTALAASGSVDSDPSQIGESLFPVANGSVTYRALVRGAGGAPLANARVRIVGRSAVQTNAAGATTIDSVAGGTQTIEVVAIGYAPERHTIDLAPGRMRADTVVMTSLGSALDTVRVTAVRDPSGFQRRRSSVRGDFLTDADVLRADPARTTSLFRGRDGLRLSYDARGYAMLEITTLAHPCSPLIFLDGYPAPPVPMIPGESPIDWLIHPDEIGGIEIYTNAGRIPPEFRRWSTQCGIVVFWTRNALGLPAASSRP